MINVQQKSGQMVQVDEKKTVEEVAMELSGVKPGDKKSKGFITPVFYSSAGKQLQVLLGQAHCVMNSKLLNV